MSGVTLLLSLRASVAWTGILPLFTLTGGIPTAKAALTVSYFHQQIRLTFKEETSEMLHLGSIALYGAETRGISENRSAVPRQV